MPRFFLEIGVAVQAHRSLMGRNRPAVQLAFRPGGSFKIMVPIDATHQQRSLPDRTGWLQALPRNDRASMQPAASLASVNAIHTVTSSLGSKP